MFTSIYRVFLCLWNLSYDILKGEALYDVRSSVCISLSNEPVTTLLKFRLLLLLEYITPEGSSELYKSLWLAAIFSLPWQICVKRCLHFYLLPICLNVDLASPTRSMICLMVCRRMMPELFWSVPASLGSLSVQDNWIESLHHISKRDQQQ